MNERGSITAFALCLTLALVMGAGLVFDGGRVVAARVEAADLAENAARAGAQEVVGIRGGDWRLDPVLAAARAERYLAELGATGSVSASEDQISVTVQQTATMTLLQLVGIEARTVVVTRTAEAVDR